MSGDSSNRDDAEFEIQVDWGRDEIIPDNTYEAMFVSQETIKGTFGAKLKITFKILTYGDFFEKQINAWYNVTDLMCPVGKNRRVKAPKGSKLVSQMLSLGYLNSRKDRLSTKVFKNKILLIKTRTVIKDGRQKKLHELQKYSVVDDILGEKK
ncbi:MAG: hypothetical protein FJY21_13090 [Bacteroidetes bacterium]|nr:hypothetical protein [Bacteroidota bacterium]